MKSRLYLCAHLLYHFSTTAFQRGLGDIHCEFMIMMIVMIIDNCMKTVFQYYNTASVILMSIV